MKQLFHVKSLALELPFTFECSVYPLRVISPMKHAILD